MSTELASLDNILPKKDDKTNQTKCDMCKMSLLSVYVVCFFFHLSLRVSGGYPPLRLLEDNKLSFKRFHTHLQDYLQKFYSSNLASFLY